MADCTTETGNRDDLVVDASRCLKMRFNESSCHRCVDICPHKAVSLDGYLAVNPNHCRGCLLCTSVCPSGALEQNSNFSACLAQLCRVQKPVLGCVVTRENAHAAIACLGGLSEEHLVYLSHSLPDILTLNLARCHDCTNNAIIIQLQQRLARLIESGLLSASCRIALAESAAEVDFREKSVDRRSFFKSFRTSLFTSAAVILSANKEQTERRTGYAENRVPKRIELLNIARENLSEEFAVQIKQQFDVCVSFTDNCTKCQGCAAICPTGALRGEAAEETPTFEQLICAGCGLCQEFCLEKALVMRPER